jgi:hypothetical protein
MKRMAGTTTAEEPTPMHFLDDLRAQKQEGQSEWNRKIAEERERESAEAARLRAEQEARRAAEAEVERIKAEQAYATLPKLVREAAAKGLKSAVLSSSFVEEHADGEKPAVALLVDRRKFYLTGWQIPFYQMCRRDGVPLTVVSEEVDTGLKRVLHRRYHFLAVDLEGL